MTTDDDVKVIAASFVGIFVLACCATTVPAYLGWNYLIVELVPGVHPCTVWQALGLTVSVRVLLARSPGGTACRAQ